MNLDLSGLIMSQGGITYWKDAYLTASFSNVRWETNRKHHANGNRGNINRAHIIQSAEDGRSKIKWSLLSVMY